MSGQPLSNALAKKKTWLALHFGALELFSSPSHGFHVVPLVGIQQVTICLKGRALLHRVHLPAREVLVDRCEAGMPAVGTNQGPVGN